MKRTTYTLALMFLAAPFALVGCGDDTNGSNLSDGSASVDSKVLPDSSAAQSGVDAGAIDASAMPDTAIVIDGAAIDTASSPDVNTSIDGLTGVKIDASAPVDTALPVDLGATQDGGAHLDGGASIDTQVDTQANAG